MAGAVEKLESAFAQWLGVQGAVAAGYGRGALWLALKLLIGGKPGADVLVPDFVCAQVPEAVRRAGGAAVFFPVQRDLTVREQDLEAAITPQTRAAVLVHYYGRVLPGMERLAGLCRRRGIVVIEDCALALGARAGDRRAGRFGDLAIFSFTKGDWCYGGGIVATPMRDWVERLRQLREEHCRPAARLAFCYGLLRRVDFAANHPGRSRVAGWLGRWLEGGLSLLEPSLRGNFFDAGRFDSLLPEFAARRALHILTHLDSIIARRRAALQDLAMTLHSRIANSASGMGLLPFRANLDPGDTGAFALLSAADGRAAEWVERADAGGCTLRLSWPAYQHSPHHVESAAPWFAGHLVILESAAS